jgi:hypothetical protein
MGITAKQRYAFRNGFKVKGVSADVAGDELDRIYRERGSLDPTLVVEEARPEDAQLHPVFEWQDEVAGEHWRKHQARNLIRSVEVIQEDKPATTVWINVQPASAAASYVPSDVVAVTPDFLAVAVSEAAKRLSAADEALGQLKRLAQEQGDDRAVLIAAAMSSLELAKQAVAQWH